MFLISAAMLGEGCAHSPAAANGGGTCVVCLFDLSASAAAQVTKDRYLQDFSKVVSVLQPGDLLIADAITENPSATMAFRTHVILPAYDAWQTSPLLHRQNIQAAKQSLIDQVSALVRGVPGTQNTAILDALYVSRKAFGSQDCRNAVERVLIIFSDGEEDSDRADFLRDDLGSSRIQWLMRKERQENHFPDLRGVQVWIAGATPDRSLTPTKIHSIEAFWTAYFDAAGASFTPDHYGPALLNFSLSRSRQPAEWPLGNRPQ